MANISDAYGTVTLVGNWTDEMRKNLNIVKEEMVSWCYNIDIFEDFTPQISSQSFHGDGRWSFFSNMESLDRWILDECKSKPELSIAFAALTTDMEKRESQLSFSYTDDEPENLLLCTGEYAFSAKGGHLIIETRSSDSYAYNWGNYLELDVGCEDQFEELLENFMNLISAAEREDEMICEKVESWVKENTTPHRPFKDMDADKIRNFKTAIHSAMEENLDEQE
jgi:hypothetical protein